jgi:ClpP class serine protease
MRDHTLLATILGGPFAIQHQTVLGYLPRIAVLMRGEGTQQAGPLAKRRVRPTMVATLGMPGAATVAGGQRVKSYDEAPEQSVAVHSLKGVMMKDDQEGLCEYVPGTATLGRSILAADAHDNVAAHVLMIDSGGGSVDGTAEFGALLKGLTKPVVAYSNGMIASAAYWAAAACARIVLNNGTCAVGSIGVMCSIVDYQPALEKLGVNFHDLRADDSDEKNEDFYQLLQGNYQPYTENVLNPLRGMFAASVKTNRPQLATTEGEKLLHGAMYFGETAAGNGLVDEIGSFHRAVELALELAEGADVGGAAGANAATTSTTTTMFGKNKFPAVAALAGLTGAAVTPALVSAANDELEENKILGAALISQDVHAALTEKAGRVDTAEAAVQATTAAVTAAGATSVADLIAQRDQAREQAAEFGSQPGALGTSSAKEKGDIEDKGGDNKDWEAIHERMLGNA